MYNNTFLIKNWTNFSDENEKVEKLEFPIEGLDDYGNMLICSNQSEVFTNAFSDLNLTD